MASVGPPSLQRYVKLLPVPVGIINASGCCDACGSSDACGAWTFHGSVPTGGSCLLANTSSVPGLVQHATCGSKQAFPTSPPTPPPHPTPPPPPIPPAPPGLQVPSLTLEQEMIMTDATGFLRDPSSPIQDADGVWHAWVVWVDPVYGGDLLHSPHSPTRTPTPTLSFHSDPSCSTIVWV
jgi:hypothetical protein